MDNSGRRLRIAVLATSLIVLPRCAGLYNQARLDRAKEAQSAFVDANLAASLDEERKHTAAIHARELSVVERQGAATRDAELQQIIGAKPAEMRELRETVRKMLKENGPPPTGRWADIAVLEPVRDYKARHASTLLTFDAVVSALDQIEAKQKQAAQ